MNKVFQYRARRTSDREWVYGYYVKVMKGIVEEEGYDHLIINDFGVQTEVYPDTVCIATGINDVTGTEIYSKDRVEFFTWENDADEDYCPKVIKVTGTVDWNEHDHAFTIGKDYGLSIIDPAVDKDEMFLLPLPEDEFNEFQKQHSKYEYSDVKYFELHIGKIIGCDIED